MRFGSKILFEDVTTTFSPGRRYGLTGPNGSGKSTFMKLLTGETPPQKGNVARPAKVGVLRQDQFAFDEETVLRVAGVLEGAASFRYLPSFVAGA